MIRETKSCIRCGESFSNRAFQSRANWERRKYCGKSCGAKDRYYCPVKKICARCGNEFTATNNRRKYCSTICLHLRSNGIWRTAKGYTWINGPTCCGIHTGKRRIQEHLMVAEHALGRHLVTKGQKREVVHHVNGIKWDNRSSNLVICTPSYHRDLHNRMETLYQQEKFSPPPEIFEKSS